MSETLYINILHFDVMQQSLQFKPHTSQDNVLLVVQLSMSSLAFTGLQNVKSGFTNIVDTTRSSLQNHVSNIIY